MIVIQGMSFRYKQNRPVLDSLSLQMEPGGVYGVLGANGVGKTTLPHLLGGLLFPKSGTVTVDGHTPQHRQPDFLEQVFYVPVDFELPNISVEAYQKGMRPFIRISALHPGRMRCKHLSAAFYETSGAFLRTKEKGAAQFCHRQRLPRPVVRRTRSSTAWIFLPKTVFAVS